MASNRGQSSFKIDRRRIEPASNGVHRVKQPSLEFAQSSSNENTQFLNGGDETALLGVEVYNQSSLEEGLLAQVDEAVEAQKRKERLDEISVAVATLIASIDRLENVRRRSGIQQKQLDSYKQELKCYQKESDRLSNPNEPLQMNPVNAGTKAVMDVLDDSTNSLIRSGDFTPFELIKRENETDFRTGKSFEESEIFDNEVTIVKEEPGINPANNLSSVKLISGTSGQNDSDYKPSSDEEDVVTDEDFEPGEDDKTQRVTKRKNGSVKKISPPSYKKCQDDGNDKAFEKRMKAMNRVKAEKRLAYIEKTGRDLPGSSSEDEDSSEIKLAGGLRVDGEIWSKLYKYQKTGVRWMWELHSQSVGGIMGDEMGLGKTIQVISFLAALAKSRLPDPATHWRGLGPVLIVAPTTLMHQWVKEFQLWAPEFRVAILHNTGTHQGTKRHLISKVGAWAKRGIRGAVLITSYATFTVEKEELLKQDWHYLILDEGHKIRNPEAQVTMAAKKFDTPHRIILSGSPMQNSLRELWSLFDFVYPGLLGSIQVFMEQFSVPITQGGYANATAVAVQTAYKCACVLRDTINPYLLRRMKEDVKMALQLPNKTEQVLFCRITDEQRELYKEYLSSRECDSILSGGIDAFVGLIMLRKLCNHPDLATGGPNRLGDLDEAHDPTVKYGYWKRSGKMAVIKSLLKIWSEQKRKVLLFSQSRQMLAILEKFVKVEGYTSLRMDGSTGIGLRQGLVQKFNEDPSIFVFLLTTRVGGLGVNLTGADRVIIFDPDWNPSTDTQARERAWRIGQKKPVTIYRLLTSGTIEEKIYHRQIFKQFLTNRILKDPKQRRFFKTNDLHELFTLTDDRDFSNSEKTETAALFAGTGSEVKLRGKKKSKKEAIDTKGQSQNIFDKLSEQKTAKVEPDDSDDEISNIKSSKSESSRACDDEGQDEKKPGRDQTEDKSEALRALARKLSQSLAASRKEREAEKLQISSKKKRKRKHGKFEGYEVPYLVKKSSFQPGDKEEQDEKPMEASITHSSAKKDNDYVLSKLFKSSGVHTALRHEKIVDSSYPDYALVEGEAEKVAQRAAKILAESRRRVRQSSDVSRACRDGKRQKLRFGQREKKSSTKHSKPELSDPAKKKAKIIKRSISPSSAFRESLFSGQELIKTTTLATDKYSKARSDSPSLQLEATFSPPNSIEADAPNQEFNGDTDVLSSSDLLSAIRCRKTKEVANKDVLLESDSSDEEIGDSQDLIAPNPEELLVEAIPKTKHDEMAEKIREFIALNDGRRSTEEVVNAFKDRVPKTESAIFRAVLKKLCSFRREPDTKKGFWILRDEFS